ncbi:MAG TPA: ribosome maturation factor RimM [Candidatus Sulfotelmatobacter sp.]|nr:ribosome maturation factor RimM [Candidatus Sulfotelmatobacter sp.]
MKPSTEDQNWVQVARIIRPRGNKGEVLAELFTDFPARLSSRLQIFLRQAQSEPRAIGLQNFWVDRNHPEHGIFHFEGCSSIDAAEKFRGFEVLIPIADRVKLPDGKYFVSDLIGCSVFENPVAEAKLSSPACAMEEAPRLVGTVQDVYFPGEGTAGTPLLQLQTAAGELLVPLAEDICRSIDVAARRIDVTLPEGLSDLNTGE